jgi:hypothetical protein
LENNKKRSKIPLEKGVLDKMINNLNEIVTQNVDQMECIIKEFAKKAVELEEQKGLTINSIERITGETIKALIQVILLMAGSLLSNIATDRSERYCECGKKMTDSIQT